MPLNKINFLIDRGSYDLAIEELHRLLEPCEEWLKYFKLGKCMYLKSNYSKAIKFYSKSLELNKSFDTYLALSKCFRADGDSLRAMSVLDKAVAFEPSFDTFYSLGEYFRQIKDYERSVASFKRALSIKKDYKCLVRLIISLQSDNKFNEAIEASLEVIQINPNPDVLSKLFNSYLNAKLYDEGIKFLERVLSSPLLIRGSSLEIKCRSMLGWHYYKSKNYRKTIDFLSDPDFLRTLNTTQDFLSFYSALTCSYTACNQPNQAVKAFEVYHLASKLISDFDPFIGQERQYLSISNVELQRLKKACLKNGLEFISSNKPNQEADLKMQNYLLYLHIPRCGGTSFQHPLATLKHALNSNISNRTLNKRGFKYLNTGNQIHGENEAKSIVNLLGRSSFESLHSAHIGYHGPRWHDVHSQLINSTNLPLMAYACVREPRERLLSQIKKDSARISYESMKEKINSGHSDYDNSIYKWIFDHQINDAHFNNRLPSQSYLGRRIDKEFMDSMVLIDLNDRKFARDVKSCFLSSSHLPNILQVQKFEASAGWHKKISDDTINEIFEYCVEKGFLDKDLALDLPSLTVKAKKYFYSSVDNSRQAMILHPVTYVCLGLSASDFVSTKLLFGDPDRVITHLLSKHALDAMAI